MTLDNTMSTLMDIAEEDGCLLMGETSDWLG